jgi:hypothetical protein
VFYVLKVLFLAVVLVPIKTYTRFGHPLFKKWYKKLFFGEIFMILLEGYIDFVTTFFMYVYYDNSVEQDGF